MNEPKIDIPETLNKLRQITGRKRFNYVSASSRERQRINVAYLCRQFNIDPVYRDRGGILW
jgi:hypothetical protein